VYLFREAAGISQHHNPGIFSGGSIVYLIPGGPAILLRYLF
jgi:hypothetical protein